MPRWKVGWLHKVSLKKTFWPLIKYYFHFMAFERTTVNYKRIRKVTADDWSMRTQANVLGWYTYTYTYKHIYVHKYIHKYYTYSKRISSLLVCVMCARISDLWEDIESNPTILQMRKQTWRYYFTCIVSHRKLVMELSLVSVFQFLVWCVFSTSWGHLLAIQVASQPPRKSEILTTSIR